MLDGVISLDYESVRIEKLVRWYLIFKRPIGLWCYCMVEHENPECTSKERGREEGWQ